jgi:3-oxoacyl-[acyl-carrier protein] reductase
VNDQAPFAEFGTIKIGDAVVVRKTFTAADVDAFARVSGDFNPLHVDDQFAARTSIGRRVVHGMLSAAYVSAMVGTRLPGPGALWTQQAFQFLAPVFVGDEVEFRLRVRHKSEATRTLVVELEARNQHARTVIRGEGTVMVLEEKRQAERVTPASVALVTGASRGIGAATARALARGRIAVLVNYRASHGRAEEVVAAIREDGGVAELAPGDVTDADAIDRLVKTAEDRFGRHIDVLVNNASGPIDPKEVLQLCWDDLQRQIDVHVRGAFNCVRAVVPGMCEVGAGRIVNIGSIFTWGVPPPKQAAYVTAKAALGALTRSLALELGPKGIRVNMLSPGMTETDLIGDVPDRLRKVYAMQTPLRRLAFPDDVASCVAMLCSPAGDFINGSDIPVCGGSAM